MADREAVHRPRILSPELPPAGYEILETVSNAMDLEYNGREQELVGPSQKWVERVSSFALKTSPYRTF
jgi:hypothetical protein